MAPKKGPAAAIMAVPAARRSKGRREVGPAEGALVPGGGTAVSENASDEGGLVPALVPGGVSAVSENASDVEGDLVPGSASADCWFRCQL